MFYAAVSAQPSLLTWFTFEYGLCTVGMWTMWTVGLCSLITNLGPKADVDF